MLTSMYSYCTREFHSWVTHGFAWELHATDSWGSRDSWATCKWLASDSHSHVKLALSGTVLSQLNHCFSSDQQLLVGGLSLVPSVMKEDSSWKEYVMDLATLYQCDLPSCDNMDMELVCWPTNWEDHVGNLPSRPRDMLVQCDYSYFPNIHTLLRIVCTLPVTSCTCERSISGLKRLKTYLWSTMGQERLNRLVMMHFDYDIDIDHDINLWCLSWLECFRRIFVAFLKVVMGFVTNTPASTLACSLASKTQCTQNPPSNTFEYTSKRLCYFSHVWENCHCFP